MATTTADHAQREAAIAQLATLDHHTWGDLGPHLTCSEADIIANFLRATGEADSAAALLEQHAAADDSGDAHWVEPEKIDVEDALDAAGDAFLVGRDRDLPEDYADLDTAARQAFRDSLGARRLEDLTYADVAAYYVAHMSVHSGLASSA